MDTSTPTHIVAVAGLISNADGQILLIKSPRRGWEFPGGQVEQGESLIQALQREIREETGVIASVGALVGVYSNVRPPTKVLFGFLGRYESGELATSDESLETEWVERTAVLQHITLPVIRDRMSDMLVFSGRVVYRVYSTEPYQIHEQLYL